VVSLLGLTAGDGEFSWQMWRLVSHGFVHPPTPFLPLVSVAILALMGRELELLLGTRRFLALYALAHLGVGGLLTLLASRELLWLGSYSGCSGAVVAVVVTFAGYCPRDRFGPLRLFALEAWLVAVLLAGALLVAAAADAWLALTGASDQLAATAVAGLCGALIGLLWARLSPILEAWLEGLSRSSMEVRLEGLGDDLELETDRILEKIAREGMKSLTPRERVLLRQASEHFQKRRQDGE
jgi:membrane associated rhomboid family serine protease